MIYETDTNRVLVYEGAAWVMIADADTPPGMQLVGSFTASGSSTTLICDNIFTDEFQNYKIIMNLNTTGTSNWVWLQYLDSAGSIIGSGYYGAFYATDFATSGSTSVFGQWNTVVLPLGYTYFDSTLQTGFDLTICNPRVSGYTTHTGQWAGIEAGIRWAAGTTVGSNGGGVVRGIRIGNNNGTNITGKVQVYGFR
jgi:hypothetical protein